MRYNAALLPALSWLVPLFLFLSAATGQTAESLRQVHRIYLGSLGQYDGSSELKKRLSAAIRKSKNYELVSALNQADAQLEGRGELWIRAYHSLSPRARKNNSYSEPVYGGYLSVSIRSRNGEILWSYFADPRRVTVHDLPRDLVDEVVTRMDLVHDEEATAPPPTAVTNEPSTQLRGGGATFPDPIYQEWIKAFHLRHPSWNLTYSASGALSGSQAGLAALASGTLDFAGSEITPASLPEQQRNLYSFLPSVGGAVVLIYNLPDFHGELHLNAELLAAIFSGSIRYWDDQRIQAANPSAALPHSPLQTFHRSDGSGTTYAFTEFLSKGSPAWSQSVGTSALPQWPAGTAVAGNDAIASAVANTPGSLGYTEFIYAFNHHLSFASIQNPAGRSVHPDLLSIMAASNQAGDNTSSIGVSIINSPEPSAYPISTLTFLVVPNNLPAEKRRVVQEFLLWMLTSGQRQCSALGYAPLPRNLVDRELSLVRSFH